MASKCSKCGYYWDWAICAPHVCPGCNEQSVFKPCDKQKGPPGRQPTPTGWICPHCKLPDKKLYYRGVCDKCYDQLNMIEAQISQVPLNKKDLPKVAPKEATPPHTEPWACPECGSMWGPEVERCRDCNNYCEGCKQYKPFYIGRLCRECYEAHSPNSKMKKEDPFIEAPDTSKVKQEPNAASIEEMKESLEALEKSNSDSEPTPPKKRLGRPKTDPTAPAKKRVKVAKRPQKPVEEPPQTSPKDSGVISIPLKLTLFQYDRIKELVAQNRFPDIDEAIRAAIRDFIFKEFEFKLPKK